MNGKFNDTKMYVMDSNGEGVVVDYETGETNKMLEEEECQKKEDT